MKTIKEALQGIGLFLLMLVPMVVNIIMIIIAFLVFGYIGALFF